MDRGTALPLRSLLASDGGIQMKYVVYEIWTRATVVEADSGCSAYLKVEPPPAEICNGIRGGLKLSNWHAVPVSEIEENSNEQQ